MNTELNDLAVTPKSTTETRLFSASDFETANQTADTLEELLG